MFRKLPVPIDDIAPSHSFRHIKIPVYQARTTLENELRDIRHRLIRLEEEVVGVIPMHRLREPKAA